MGAVTKWFHGTTSAYQHQFDHVMAHKSKLQSDFGRGFYLTQNVQQARDWASRKSASFSSANPNAQIEPMIVTCGIDLVALRQQYTYHSFGSSVSSDFLNYLVYNRVDSGIPNTQLNWDAVYGLVADGKQLDTTLSKYKAGQISVLEASRKIKYTQIQLQLCIKNQAILDSNIFSVLETNIIKGEVSR